MALQFIHDNKGNTTGVFIPIEEWQLLKTKYAELQKEEAKNVRTSAYAGNAASDKPGALSE